MNVRLFNDNGLETFTVDGQKWSELTETYLMALVDKAVKDRISLRDLSTVVMDKMAILTAESRLRRQLDEWKLTPTDVRTQVISGT